MNRRERLRAYWEQRIPPSAKLYLSDVARHLDGVVSLRTLQRRALEGALPVIGGRDRAVREYRVLREDLITFLVDLDALTGREPPPPRPPGERRSEPAPVRAAVPTRPPARPGQPRRPSTHQGNLFDD